MKKDGNWYKIGFQRQPTIVSLIFGTKEKKVDLLYNISLFVTLVVTYFLYGFRVWDNLVAFLVSSSIFAIRIIAYLVEKLTNDDIWEKFDEPRTQKGLFILDYIIISYGVIMMFNLIFDFRLWWRIGIVNRWIDEIAISINSLLFTLILLGVYLIYANKDELKTGKFKGFSKEEGTQSSIFFFLQVLLLIIFPTLLIIFLIPVYKEIDLILFNGYIGSMTYSGQAMEDWFGFVFYIIFQAPIPSIMIAFMGISSIAVILAQNLANVGRTISGVAVGIIAVIPMLFVLSAITGSIPPPPELVDIIGLSKGVASFVYGLGLIINYIVMVSIMGVFIMSSRALGMDFA
jgi:uncharacterized membrane protein (DUF485 family)